MEWSGVLEQVFVAKQTGVPAGIIWRLINYARFLLSHSAGNLSPFWKPLFTNLMAILFDGEKDRAGPLCQGPPTCLQKGGREWSCPTGQQAKDLSEGGCGVLLLSFLCPLCHPLSLMHILKTDSFSKCLFVGTGNGWSGLQP